jgi:hypothetical protein
VIEASRSSVVSSFTIIKGSLIPETYEVFQGWDFSLSRLENLRRVREENSIGGTSTHWARDVAKVLNRRFDPAGRDRPLVELAKADMDQDSWRPILLFHMTRDEFLLRDFLVNWLYDQFVQGAFRLTTTDVVAYLHTLNKKKGIEWSGRWSEKTTARVASGLLKIASDFGLLKGATRREFNSYHLPETSFLYLLQAIAETESNARRIVDARDWRLFLLDPADVERELLRLHQFRKLDYQAAGSLSQLKLPHPSAAAYTSEICA